MMRSPRLSIAVLCISGLVSAAAASAQMKVNDDRLISYSGLLQDGVGPISDVVSLRVALFTGNSSATDANDCLRNDFTNCGLWGEELTNVVVSAGRFAIVLGKINPLPDSDLASDQLWVALGVKGANDAEFSPLSGRQQLIAVPYASRAAAAKDYKVTGSTFLEGPAYLQDAAYLQGPAYLEDHVRMTLEEDVDGNNASSGTLVIGDDTQNIGIDDNEIMARSSNNTLYLQQNGGPVDMGGAVHITQWLRLECASCGSASSLTTSGDNYGTLTIQGRVISGDQNIHLSPPGGRSVIISDDYRAAGGVSSGSGAGLKVEGPVSVGGRLNLRVEGTAVNSETDSNPEVYRLNVSCTRGDLWVGRPSAANNQDALCACLEVNGTTSPWCFNP